MVDKKFKGYTVGDDRTIYPGKNNKTIIFSDYLKFLRSEDCD